MDTSISDNLISKKEFLKRKNHLYQIHIKYLKKKRQVSLSPTKRKPTKIRRC